MDSKAKAGIIILSTSGRYWNHRTKENEMTPENETPAIDTVNRGFIGFQDGSIVIGFPRRIQRMTKAEALVAAAWLVVLADDSEDHAEFQRALDAVMAT